MLSKEELIKLSDPDDSELNNDEYAAKLSVLSRGYPYYGQLKKKFPIHWMSFSGMYKRKRQYEIEIDSLFKRNVDGFIEFILYIGDVPKYMISPSVGRIDHSKGYIIGNFRWESAYSNSIESGIRNGWKHSEGIKLSNIKRRKIPNETVKIIRNFRIGKLKDLTETKFINYCIEWLNKKFDISISKCAIREILNNTTYKDVI